MQYNSNMTSPSLFKRLTQRLLDLTGYFTIAVVAIISFITIDDPGARSTALGLTVAFAVVNFLCERARQSQLVHLFFAVQTVLVIGLMLQRPNAFVAPILFFILSAQAAVELPPRQAALWIGIFILVTGAFTFAMMGWPGGLISVLPYIGGYSFFAAFGRASRNAEEARQQSQRLLEELRAAQGQLQQLAVAEERNRLARELHDALGHRLTVAVVQLEGAQRLIPTEPERAARMIGAMREQMKEALGDLRRTVATLRTPLEDDLPLGPALTRLAQSFQEGTGLTVKLSISPGLPPLPESHRLALYRAGQESLTNAQRHAEAKHIQLDLSLNGEAIVLTATDDGQGLPADLNGSGFGLKGLRERAAQLGGDLQLGPGPNGGAQVRLSLPMTTRDEG